jgi:hypothetical protein
MKRIRDKLVVAILLFFSISVLAVSSVQAMTITTSEHTYTSYSLNIHNGQEVNIKSSDMVNYYNNNEKGFINTIEKNAWFYRTGGQSGLGNAIMITPLSKGAGISVYEIEDSNKLIPTVKIKGTSVGCTRISGLFEWRNNIKNPTVIHKYPFQAVIYNHVNVNGMNIISNAKNNTGNINNYIYEGSKENIVTNVLPFKSEYISWDKVHNNAIQFINVTNSNTSVASITNLSSTGWGASTFVLNGLQSGNSTVKVVSSDNSSYGCTMNVKVIKKPKYSVSANEITLVKGTSVNDYVKAFVTNLDSNNKCSIKWTSSNPALLEVKNNTATSPTLITKGTGTVTLKCEFTDLVAANNKGVNPTAINIKVNVKDDKEIKNIIKTSNNTYIEHGDLIYSDKVGDVVFVRVEEEGMEAVRSFVSSDTNVCTVEPTSRSGYSFQIVKRKAGTSTITVTSKSGKVVTFKYIASPTISDVVEPYSNKKPLKPKFKSIKVKNKKIYISFKGKPSKYKAKGFQIKVKRGKKTVIKCKWYKKKLKITNIKKHSKYVIYVRSFYGNKFSKWVKKAKKVK